MQARIIHLADPFNPARRDISVLRRRRRLRALAPKTRLPHICLVNGQPVLRAGWNRRIRNGDTVAFIMLPLGGGGGDSNPLRIIAMIAVMILAPQVGFYLDTTLGISGTVWSAATVVAGMALVNTLIPLPLPPTAQLAAAMAAPSPTYSLGAQGNSARIGQPIPVLYGRHVIFPDFAAQPYTDYAGNEQYLYQLFVVGQGSYNVGQIRLEDTMIEPAPLGDGAIHTAAGSFEEISYQLVQPGGSVTLFPANVVTSTEVTGQELPGIVTGTYTQSGTTITVTRSAHGFGIGKNLYHDFTTGGAASGDYTVTGVPTVDTYTVTSGTSATIAVSNVTIHSYVGPYTINTADGNALAVDYVTPRGLYFANDDGSLAQRSVIVSAYARLVGSTGAWMLLGTETLTAATATPQRKSYKYTVAAGSYQVKVRRTNTKDGSSRAGNDLNWAAARAYLPGSQAYGQITLLALRMRASNQLSGLASRKINVIATRLLPAWNGSAWGAASDTTSIAWALADICRSSYGLGLPDARIDLAGLLALDAVWAARGDQFNGVFDGNGVAWECLQQVAKAGRAIPVMQGGIVHFVRDAAATLPLQMFTVRNIVRGSFKLDYTMPSEETADAIDVTYFDSGVWQERTVRCALPGSAELIVAKVKLFGVTNRAQAYREGMYQAACNRYRRRHATLTTEMEGLIVTLGDLIVIQHDMPQWGQGGEVTNFVFNGLGLMVTATENFDFSAGGDHYISFRTRAGGAVGPYLCTAGTGANQIWIAGWPFFDQDAGGDRERTHYAFGPAAAQYIKARVVRIRPRSAETVEIAAVVESDYVHTADTGSVPSSSAWQLATRIIQPVIAGLITVSNLDYPEKMFISWAASPQADHYLIEIRDAANTGDAGWTRLAETRTANFTGTAQYGNRTMLRVCAVGLTRGAWVEINYGSSASYMWNALDTTLMWGTSTNAMWRY